MIKKPVSISIDITYKCNYRCLHCFNHSGEDKGELTELTDGELIKLFEDLTKLQPQSVCLCGGEPLLRKEIAYELIEIMKKITLR